MKIEKIKPVDPKINYRYKELYDALPTITKDQALQVHTSKEEKINTIYSALISYLQQHKIRDKYRVMKRQKFLIIQMK